MKQNSAGQFSQCNRCGARKDWCFRAEKSWPEKDAKRAKRMDTAIFLILLHALGTGGKECYMS